MLALAILAGLVAAVVMALGIRAAFYIEGRDDPKDATMGLRRNQKPIPCQDSASHEAV